MKITMGPLTNVRIKTGGRRTTQPAHPHYRGRPPRGPADEIYFLNDASETVPAHGIIRVTGATLLGDQNLLLGDKPSTTLSRLYLVNDCLDVPQDEIGRAFLSLPKLALYDTAATPAYGEGWGPKPSEWKLFKGYPGFTILGNHASGSVLAEGGRLDKLLGKTDAAHAKAASGTVSVYIGTAGSESDSTINVTAYNKFAAVATTKWVWVEWSNNSWYLTAAEC